ncbi:uncharacterized protein BKA78DRAFT_317955 [Phyllosticta capitalensis]|uniref:uncharacterized protein n=1 Tax=Phyllosticta capitalensis TaxID=121624 RepID=UPI00312EE3AF
MQTIQMNPWRRATKAGGLDPPNERPTWGPACGPHQHQSTSPRTRVAHARSPAPSARQNLSVESSHHLPVPE